MEDEGAGKWLIDLQNRAARNRSETRGQEEGRQNVPEFVCMGMRGSGWTIGIDSGYNQVYFTFQEEKVIFTQKPVILKFVYHIRPTSLQHE